MIYNIPVRGRQGILITVHWDNDCVLAEKLFGKYLEWAGFQTATQVYETPL